MRGDDRGQRAQVATVGGGGPIYRRALLITGHRVRLREVIGGRAVS
ncbi:MAG TPA: hypothetical protein VII33_10780 [Nakamurella sp.]